MLSGLLTRSASICTPEFIYRHKTFANMCSFETFKRGGRVVQGEVELHDVVGNKPQSQVLS